MTQTESAEPAPSANRSQTAAWPVFLIGSERSGTTLLRLMLDHHPAIAWCNEFEYAVDPLQADGTPPTIEQYREWLSTHRIFQATGFTLDPTRPYARLVDSFLHQGGDQAGKPHVGATVHRHYAHLRRLWPNCRFIYLYRDGRDVARSCIRMGWAGNVWRAIPRWTDAEREWEALQATLDPATWIEVCFETLVSEPEPQLQRLCEFLGVEYDPTMLEYPADTTYGYPDASLTRQWRRKLTAKELGLIEAIAGDRLEARGYPLSEAPPRPVSASYRQWLRLHDLWGRQRFRMKRYGPWLAAAESFTKRLGPRARWKTIRHRINEIDRGHLK